MIKQWAREIALFLIDPHWFEQKTLVFVLLYFSLHTYSIFYWAANAVLLSCLVGVLGSLSVSFIGYMRGANAHLEFIRLVTRTTSRFRQIQVINEEELNSKFPTGFRDSLPEMLRPKSPLFRVIHDRARGEDAFTVQSFPCVWETSYVVINRNRRVEDLTPGQRFPVYHEFSHITRDGVRILLWRDVHLMSCVATVLMSFVAFGGNALSAGLSAVFVLSGLWIWTDKRRQHVEAETFADKYELWGLEEDSRDDALKVAKDQIEHHSRMIASDGGNDGLTARHLLENMNKELKALSVRQTITQRLDAWSGSFYASRWYVYAACIIYALGMVAGVPYDSISMGWVYSALALLIVTVAYLLVGALLEERKYRRWIDLWLELGAMIDDGKMLDVVREVAPVAANAVEEDIPRIIAAAHSLDRSFAEKLQPPKLTDQPHFPFHQYAQEVFVVATVVISTYEGAAKWSDFADFILDHDRKLEVANKAVDRLKGLGLNRTAASLESIVDKVLDYLTRPKT
ncbi:hypothetical protein JQ625_22910 [Bradyrhizobium diazoefficiens]|nr:hypothetical protein [Bradyrhizobium diazoefficiens]MBR0777695.1 hypothetical protein [Bradyrhizobium diazoefficiens]